MRGRVIRRGVSVVAIAAWWLLASAWVLGVGWSTPWSPARSHAFSGSKLGRVMGIGQASADGLSVNGLGGYDQGLQSWRLAAPLDSADYRVLRYDVEHFPRTLELDLVIRSSVNPGDVSVTRLPWPRDGRGSVDLSGIAAWRGKILELGFSEVAAIGRTPPDVEATPFTIGGARLESASWRGALAVLASRWFAYRPWTLASINTVKIANEAAPRRSPVTWLALGLGGTLVLLALVGGWRGRRLRVAAVVLVAVGWLALDANWLLGWQARDQLTRSIFGGKPWSARAAMTFDGGDRELAGRIAKVLAGQPADSRVLLWTADHFRSLRLEWFLRPFNIGPLGFTIAPASIPDGTLVMIVDSNGTWHYDQARGELVAGRYRLPGDLIYHASGLKLVAIRKAAGS